MLFSAPYNSYSDKQACLMNGKQADKYKEEETSLSYLLSSKKLKRYQLLLAIFIVSLGIYLICTTGIISKDGTKYIRQAQSVSGDQQLLFSRSYGYPLLIFLFHKTLTALSVNDNLQLWIYSGQAVSLVCRVLTVLIFFHFAREYVHAQAAFISTVIISFLPHAGHWGSEVIREWPYLLFLLAGFTILIKAIRKTDWRYYSLGGILCACAYAIRPEGIQLLIFAFVPILAGLFPVAMMGRLRGRLIGVVCFAACFLVLAGPYTYYLRRPIPKKLEKLFQSDTRVRQNDEINHSQNNQYVLLQSDMADVPIFRTIEGITRLIESINENLFYFFSLPTLIGIWRWYKRKQEGQEVQRMLLLCFVFLNAVLLILLYNGYGYITRRHSLPLTAMCLVFTPLGIDAMAAWFAKKNGYASELLAHRRRVYFIILFIGFGICIPKLVEPVGVNKRVYREAAMWLSNEITSDTRVYSFDPRILFYAGIAVNSPPQISTYQVLEENESRWKASEMSQTWEVIKRFKLPDDARERGVLVIKRE